MSNPKKRRLQSSVPSRTKAPKHPSKPSVEDLFPFQVPNIESVNPQIKQYINQLQRQYIERYNILIKNRIIFQQIVENMSNQLEEKGVAVGDLMELYRQNVSARNKNDDNHY